MNKRYPSKSGFKSWKEGKLSPILLNALLWIFILLIFSGGMLYAQKEQAVPVTSGTAVQKDVPLQIRTFGNAEAFASVSVKARVGGELTKVFFQEGQEVKEGDPMFTIDPQPYEAALNEAKAKLARDIALTENAEADLRRYENLFKEGIVSKEEYDSVSSNTAALKATVEADKAAVETAQLDLGYCFIHSPITGRTGRLLVDKGNLIKENADSAMVVIHKVQPIYVNFVVPEQNFSELSKRMSQEKLEVDAIVPNEKDHPVQGALTFIDNEVDKNTGTIRLKATFANKEKLLWPGQYVDVILTIGVRPNVVVVPSQAVQTGQEGTYVFVIKADLTVESRPVVADMNVNGETVIEKGIEAGEKVVLDGQLRLVSGSKVEIKSTTAKEKS